jgi:hypothetical protein
MIGVPNFIQTVPRLLGLPEQHDNETDMPMHPDEIGRWKDGEAYVAMLREAEQSAGSGHKLSHALVNKDDRDTASIIYLF